MQTKLQLQQAIQKSMVNKFERMCDFREIQNLPKIIDNDEYIIQAVNGFFSRDSNERYHAFNLGGSNGTGLIILTNKEIILFDHHLFAKSESPSIPLNKIHSVAPHNGLFYGYIYFDDGSDNPFCASHILAWKCAPFKKAVDEAISRFSNNNNSNNIVSQLQKLYWMYQNRQISLSDYNKLKARIVD